MRKIESNIVHNGLINKTSTNYYKGSKQAGFTLIELLVVIAIIGILAAILLPVLAAAKQRAWEAGCINNKKQIQMAWFMYAQDNNDHLVLNHPDTGAASPSWVQNILDWTTNTYNVDETQLSSGLLGDYTAKNNGCYRCPADTYLSPPQHVMGWDHRIRSVRMNKYLACVPNETTWSAPYTNNFKMSDIKSPTALWVFIDAHPDTSGSPYDGTFSLPPGQVPGSWDDLPASYHNKRNCGFSFADGHAEIHRWLSGTTLVPVTYIGSVAGITKDVTVNVKDQRDILWTYQHAYNSGVQ